MPTSSGRYQSQLFNFLVRQSIRIKDKSSQTWRQAKVAAVWSVQILLYPVYVAVQTGRLVGKQLRQTVRQALPQLKSAQHSIQRAFQPDPPPELMVDTPIDRVLQAIQDLALVLPPNPDLPQLEAGSDTPQNGGNSAIQLAPTGSLATGSPPSTVKLAIAGPATGLAQTGQDSAIFVQGVASLLDSRDLVLVTVHNQVLNVLTADQQAQLARRIVWELADYWRQQRVFGRASAAALNGRSLLVDRFLPLPKPRSKALPPIQTFWQVMAWMQTGSVAIATNLFQEAQLALLLPSSTDPDIPPSDHPTKSAQPSWSSLDDLVARWLNASPQALGSRLARWLQTGPLAVVTHLLGESDAIHPPGQPMVDLPTSPSSNSPQSPWLTMEGLFGIQWQPSVPQPNAAGAIAPSGTNQLTQPLSAHSLEHNGDRAASPSIAMHATLSSASVVQAAETPGFLSTTTVSSSSSEQSSALSGPSWIDTEARLVAYEKHPLEQLLQWLDQGMAWVEGTLEKVWTWLRDRLAARSD
jgi:hypothetical protein